MYVAERDGTVVRRRACLGHSAGPLWPTMRVNSTIQMTLYPGYEQRLGDLICIQIGGSTRHGRKRGMPPVAFRRDGGGRVPYSRR